MCELSNSYVNGFQSWYFPDKPYYLTEHRFIVGDTYSTIMLTRPCNFDPLEPNFYIVKIGFTRV